MTDQRKRKESYTISELEHNQEKKRKSTVDFLFLGSCLKTLFPEIITNSIDINIFKMLAEYFYGDENIVQQFVKQAFEEVTSSLRITCQKKTVPENFFIFNYLADNIFQQDYTKLSLEQLEGKVILMRKIANELLQIKKVTYNEMILIICFFMDAYFAYPHYIRLKTEESREALIKDVTTFYFDYTESKKANLNNGGFYCEKCDKCTIGDSDYPILSFLEFESDECIHLCWDPNLGEIVTVKL
jgi:hypothetical protein